jgi:hypothetical protein
MHRLLLLVLPLLIAAEPPNWVRETEKAGWKPRDSQGEVVFKDRLWVMGGWYDSLSSPPRDVWSSADGKTWEEVTPAAPWKHSDLPMTAVHDGKMWLLGGWYNGRLKDHSASNEVWSSTDGKDWKLVTKAPWSARIAGGLVTFDGKLWLLGGTDDYYFGDDSSLKNDVWCSANGKDWTQVTAKAAWSPRAYHQAVVHDGKMWVLGGGNYVPRYQANNDVWFSTDGKEWTRAVEHAPWHERIWFSSVVYRDRIWVLGGWSKGPDRNWGDVWYSKDGKSWTEYKPAVTWKARHEHSAYVFKDRIWIAGGHAQPLSSEVWSLEIPKDYPLP